MAESVSKTGPTQKRRSGKRTARACDECRLRKSKCDGLQPCEACQSTDRYCTFNLSAGRSTGSGTRIRILEDRLRRARAYLNEAQKRTPSLANVDFDALLGPTEEPTRPDPKLIPHEDDDNMEDESADELGQLESMMDSYGQMDLNSHGGNEREFYGAASGLAWIQRTRHYFDDDDASTTSASSDHPDVENAAAVQLFDAPLPPAQALHPDPSVPHILPPRETAMQLVRVVFTQVYPMFHFLCEEDFHDSTDRIYNHYSTDFDESDQSFLPLFYLVMALGYLFSRNEHSQHGCRASVGEAMRYFIAARNMLDIAHLRTVESLQAVISLILYLVSTARMASAHAFLGAACAAAMRQGLHFRSTHEIEFPDKERKVRRRVFWAVMNLDMYVTSILGLPPFMDITATDPAIDLTIEVALNEGRNKKELPSPDGVALMASAKHIELMRVVFKAQKALYPKPLDPPDSATRDGKISVSVRKLQAVESQFREWAESLTEILTYPDDSIETQSAKYEMHSCYYFAQIVLYRAFLHYLAKPQDDKSCGQRELNYAMTCVTMAKKVVEISVEHQRKGLLCPASWPSVYTVFISVVCLVFAYATRNENAQDDEMRKDIEDGIRLLACTACTTDTGSVRCLEILRRLLQRVSYAIDVEFDDICAGTKPCCTVDFSSRAQGDDSANLNELHIARPNMSDSEKGSSVPSSMPSIESDGHHWSLSPDVTMTQPSFSELNYAPQAPEQPNSQAEGEQMVDIPNGGMFNWYGGDGGSIGFGAEQSSDDQQDLEQQRSTPAPENVRLTAEDIAAFMHSNPLDEHISRGSR